MDPLSRSPRSASLAAALLALCGAGAGTGCCSCRAGAPADAPAPAAATATFEVVSGEGTYRVAFRPAPADLPLNEFFDMAVSVSAAAGESGPLPDIDLSVDAAMPAHRHGMNTRPIVVRQPDGTFAVTGMLLHMAGEWELYFDVVRGGATERAQVAVELE